MARFCPASVFSKIPGQARKGVFCNPDTRSARHGSHFQKTGSGPRFLYSDLGIGPHGPEAIFKKLEAVHGFLCLDLGIGPHGPDGPLLAVYTHYVRFQTIILVYIALCGSRASMSYITASGPCGPSDLFSLVRVCKTVDRRQNGFRSMRSTRLRQNTLFPRLTWYFAKNGCGPEAVHKRSTSGPRTPDFAKNGQKYPFLSGPRVKSGPHLSLFERSTCKKWPASFAKQ